MKLPRPPHRWRVSPKRAVAIQHQMAARVVRRGRLDRVRLVAGVDAAFPGGASCLAAAVVWDLERGEIVEARWATRPLDFPYVPGLLSFREAPAILAALRRLHTPVDAIICDGHGLAHPRGFGLACHLGVICDLPSVGCAKRRLVGAHASPSPDPGRRTPLRYRGRIVGTVLRTKAGSNPVYVSIGHRLDLRSAAALVLRCTAGHRLPEPTHAADRLVGQRAASSSGRGCAPNPCGVLRGDSQRPTADAARRAVAQERAGEVASPAPPPCGGGSLSAGGLGHGPHGGGPMGPR